MIDPTKRFSNRVENYLKYRPRYPDAIIPLLESQCRLTPQSVVADIGSGTGFLTEPLVKVGCRVFAVEPNAEMRAAGENLLAGYSNLVSINATAEETSLPPHAVDLIVAGQAFHWFDRVRARTEFERILKPGGWIALVWNVFHRNPSLLIKGYQQIMLRYGTDYKEVNRELAGLDVKSFFGPGGCNFARFPYRQVFDFAGLKGRFLSASYAPEPGHPHFEAALRDLHDVFEASQKNGRVDFDYETEVYYGQFG